MSKVKKGLHPEKQPSQSVKTICLKSDIIPGSFFFLGSVINLQNGVVINAQQSKT